MIGGEWHELTIETGAEGSMYPDERYLQCSCGLVAAGDRDTMREVAREHLRLDG